MGTSALGRSIHCLCQAVCLVSSPWSFPRCPCQHMSTDHMHFILETPERRQNAGHRLTVSSIAAASGWAAKIPRRVDKIPGTGAWSIRRSTHEHLSPVPNRSRGKLHQHGRPSCVKPVVRGVVAEDSVRFDALRLQCSVIPACIAGPSVLPEALRYCQSFPCFYPPSTNCSRL